jgi:hypothetical protein
MMCDLFFPPKVCLDIYFHLLAYLHKNVYSFFKKNKFILTSAALLLHFRCTSAVSAAPALPRFKSNSTNRFVTAPQSASLLYTTHRNTLRYA